MIIRGGQGSVFFGDVSPHRSHNAMSILLIVLGRDGMLGEWQLAIACFEPAGWLRMNVEGEVEIILIQMRSCVETRM